MRQVFRIGAFIMKKTVKYIKERNFSSHTARAYLTDIKNFIIWLDSKSPLEVDSKTYNFAVVKTIGTA